MVRLPPLLLWSMLTSKKRQKRLLMPRKQLRLKEKRSRRPRTLEVKR